MSEDIERNQNGHELKPKAIVQATIAHLISGAVGSALIALVGTIWAAIKDANPWILVVSIGWFLSALIGAIFLTRIKWQNAAEIQRLNEKQENEIQRIKMEFELQHSNITKVTHGLFELRTEAHHLFVHAARDAIVRCYHKDILKGPRTISLIDALHRKAPKELDCMLSKMVETFSHLVSPDTKLFASVRERSGDHKYVTKIRVGKCDHERRKAGTEPLVDTDPMLIDLHASFKKNECVLLTGSQEPNWRSDLKNNRLGEDFSVLMGAVFSKELLPKRFQKNGNEWRPRDLEWIVCLAASTPGAFNSTHLPLMKCFNDTFSLLLNVLIRFPVSPGSGSQPLSNP